MGTSTTAVFSRKAAFGPMLYPTLSSLNRKSSQRLTDGSAVSMSNAENCGIDCVLPGPSSKYVPLRLSAPADCEGGDPVDCDCPDADDSRFAPRQKIGIAYGPIGLIIPTH